MIRPLALPRLTSDAVAQRNAVFHRRVAMRAHWLDRQWTWSLQPLSQLPHSSRRSAWLEAEWGEARAYATVPEALMLNLAAAMLRSGQLSDLPTALRLLERIKETVGELSLAPYRPVLLTSMDIRRYMRKMIEQELYELPVLSYQELIPEINIQPLARIEL